MCASQSMIKLLKTKWWCPGQEENFSAHSTPYPILIFTDFHIHVTINLCLAALGINEHVLYIIMLLYTDVQG